MLGKSLLYGAVACGAGPVPLAAQATEGALGRPVHRAPACRPMSA